MKVYDLEGKEHDKLSVDARECVDTLGWTYDRVKRSAFNAVQPPAPVGNVGPVYDKPIGQAPPPEVINPEPAFTFEGGAPLTDENNKGHLYDRHIGQTPAPGIGPVPEPEVEKRQYTKKAKPE